MSDYFRRANVNALLSALEPEHRDRCLVLDGLTKSLGASNIRSAHLLASTKVVPVNNPAALKIPPTRRAVSGLSPMRGHHPWP